MKIKITRKDFLDLSKKIRSRLHADFTLKYDECPEGSYMREVMEWEPENLDTFIAWSGNKILGWGGVTIFHGKKLLMLYVDPKHREKGIAKEILRAVKKVKKYRSINMSPWNPVSNAVVKRFKKRFKLGVIE